LGTLLTELSKRLGNRSPEELVSELEGFEGSIAEIQQQLGRLSVAPKMLNFRELKNLNDKQDFVDAQLSFVDKHLELSKSGRTTSARAFGKLFLQRDSIEGPSNVSKACEGYTGIIKVLALYHTHRDHITWCTESGEPVDLPSYWIGSPPSHAAKKAFYRNAIKKCCLNRMPKVADIPIFTRNANNSWNVDGVAVTTETDMHFDLKRHFSLPSAKCGVAATTCAIYLLLVKEGTVFDYIGTQVYIGKAVNGTASRWRSNGNHHQDCIDKAVNDPDASVQLVELVLALVWIRDKSWKNVALIDFRTAAAADLLKDVETSCIEECGGKKYNGLNS